MPDENADLTKTAADEATEATAEKQLAADEKTAAAADTAAQTAEGQALAADTKVSADEQAAATASAAVTADVAQAVADEPVAPVTPPVDPPVNPPVTPPVTPPGLILPFSASAAGKKNFYAKRTAATALDPKSSTIAPAVVKAVQALYSGWSLNCYGFAPTQYFVDSTVTQMQKVNVLGWSGSPKFVFECPIPANAVADPQSDSSGNGDHGLNIFDLATGVATEMWGAVKTSSGWTCLTAGQQDSKSGNGIFQWGSMFHSESASNISYLATTIKIAELEAGVIPHALALALPDASSGFELPATNSDGSSSGIIKEGSRLSLPMDVVIPTASLIAGMVTTAFRDYGGLVVDRSGSGAIICQNNASVGTNVDNYKPFLGGKQAYNVLADVPWGSLTLDAPETA